MDRTIHLNPPGLALLVCGARAACTGTVAGAGGGGGNLAAFQFLAICRTEQNRQCRAGTAPRRSKPESEKTTSSLPLGVAFAWGEFSLKCQMLASKKISRFSFCTFQCLERGCLRGPRRPGTAPWLGPIRHHKSSPSSSSYEALVLLSKRNPGLLWKGQ